MAKKPTYEELEQGGSELEDVTSQHGGIERHLQQTELFYSMVLQNMSDAVFLTDDAGTLVYICPNVDVIFGYSSDEVREMVAIDELLGEQSSIRRKLKTSNELANIPCDITDKAGTIHSLLVNVKRVSIKGRTTLYVCRDITERKRLEDEVREAHNQLEIRVQERTHDLITANERLKQEIKERKKTEEALRNSELELRTILDHQEDFVLLQDLENRILWANAAAGKSVGGPREALIGRFCYEFWAEASEVCPDCAVAEAIRTGKPQSIEKTIPDGRAWRVRGCPIRNERGEITHALEVAEDITERKQVQEERIANLHFLESMDRVNRAIQRKEDLEQMMSDVLDEVLSIFDCDRAALVYPCDPEAQSWTAPMERFRPPYDGVLALGLQVPMDDEVAFCHRLWRSSDGPVPLGQEHEIQMPDGLRERSQIQTQLGMAIYPKDDRPWLFVIHQCSRSRFWQQRDMRLLEEIGRRLTDGLTSLSIYRDLKEKERKYRELADSITDVFFAMDTDLKYIYWNKASENVTGIKAEDAIGKSIFEVFPDTEEMRKAAAVYQDVLKKKQPKSFETEYRLDGKHYFFEINAYPTADGISVFAKDITERKQSEEALRNAELEQRMILDHQEDLVVFQDLENRIIWANQAAGKSLGMPREKLIGRLCYELWAEDSEVCRDCAVAKAVKTGKPQSIEKTTPDGRAWRVRGCPIQNERGEITHALEVTEDITERKRVERELLESEERYSTLSEASFEGVLIHDEGTIVAANTRFAEMHGYEPSELPEIDALGLIAPEHRDMVRGHIASGFEGPYEVVGLRKDSTRFPVEIQVRHMKYSGRDVRVAVSRDITKQKQAEQELREQAQHLEEVNSAMKVLLELREKEKDELAERLVTNVQKTVFPYLDSLDSDVKKAHNKTCVNIIKSNLEHLLSPFASKLSERTLNLTPTELRVADMVKHGKTSKEIASLLNVSPDAILFHRKNIRKRLGLAKKKINLRSYLQSLSAEA